MVHKVAINGVSSLIWFSRLLIKHVQQLKKTFHQHKRAYKIRASFRHFYARTKHHALVTLGQIYTENVNANKEISEKGF